MNIQRNIEPPVDGDYETDFHAWLFTQANALRSRDPSGIDWPNRLSHYRATLPTNLPYDLEQILELDWFPNPPA